MTPGSSPSREPLRATEKNVPFLILSTREEMLRDFLYRPQESWLQSGRELGTVVYEPTASARKILTRREDYEHLGKRLRKLHECWCGVDKGPRIRCRC